MLFVTHVLSDVILVGVLSALLDDVEGLLKLVPILLLAISSLETSARLVDHLRGLVEEEVVVAASLADRS